MINTFVRCSASYRALAAIAGLGGGLLLLTGSAADAKIPGKTHCYFGICHRVKTLPETEQLVGRRINVQASFYDDCKVDRFNPCTLTSSGEVFRPDRPDNAASPIYPDGTRLMVWNPKTKAAAVIRVNSAGPYHGKRTLDVSRATADKLGFRKSGVATLQVQVLSAPTPQETRYKKNRKYPPVPGPMGLFASLETALLDLTRVAHNLTITPLQVAELSRPPVKTFASPKVSPKYAAAANAKTLNAAGRHATIAAFGSVGGGVSNTSAFTTSALMMSAIPHSSFQPELSLAEKARQLRAKGGRPDVAERSRKITSPRT